MTKRRALYYGVRLGLLTAAAACIALGAKETFASLDERKIVALAAMLAVYIAVLRAPVPLHVHVRGARRLPTPRVPLEIPLIAVALTLYGGVACAALILAAHVCAFSPDQRQRLIPRLMDAGCEATFWLIVGLSRELVVSNISMPAGFFIFTAVYAMAAFAYAVALWTPLVAVRDGLAPLRLWLRIARDPRLPAAYLSLAAWGWFCALAMLREGEFFGILALLPIAVVTLVLRRMHVGSQELHRLRLARNAVQALLDARDPVPQINSLLAAMHAHDDRITLQIFSTTHDRVAPLASIGPLLDETQRELARQALIQAQHTDRKSVALRTHDYAVSAYPVRSGRGMFAGALLVHRPARVQVSLDSRRFEGAAKELAPLLGDLHSISQTQTAASIDGLTGLANRRTIMTRVRAEIENFSIGTQCAVMLMDVDRFKSINDTLGHGAGDHVLRTLGRVISRNIRSVDRAGRIGGEEFLILMPQTARETAMAVAERLRRAILEADLRYAGGNTVSASIGVTVAEVSDTVDSLLARADRALYEAKRQGRNRVVETSA